MNRLRRIALLLALVLAISSCGQDTPQTRPQYSDRAIQEIVTAWSEIPTMRMGVNYYLAYHPEYVSENSSVSSETLYWGISVNVVNGKYECDYYGYGYALPEPYMSKMEQLALSNNEIESISQNIFGEDKYGLDFYVREVDSDGITYIYRKDDKGYYRYIEPLDEYDEFASLRPEYIKDLKSIGNYQLSGTYTTSMGVKYNAVITLNKKVPVPETMNLECLESTYGDGLLVDWQQVDFRFYDFTSELQMTDEIYKEAKDRFQISVSSEEVNLVGGYYLTEYMEDFTPGQEVILDTQDSYFKYSDTYYFALPEGTDMTVIFTTSANTSVSVQEIVCIDDKGVISNVWLEGDKWKTRRVVQDETEIQFVKIENNQNMTFTYTGDYMLERVITNVLGAVPTNISQNAVAGSHINYLGQNVIITEQSVWSGGNIHDLTEPPDPTQVISYNSVKSGNVRLASAGFANKLAKLENVSQNELADFIMYYGHDPQTEVQPEVLELFEYVRPITDYLFSIYDITTYDLEHIDNEQDLRFYGYSSDRTVCISIGVLMSNMEYPPTIHYLVTQLIDMRKE